MPDEAPSLAVLQRLNQKQAEEIRRLNEGDRGGTSGGGMDAWQTSVESRLGGLDNRLGKIDDRLGAVEQSLATLTERVSHLPTSAKLYATAVGIVVALTAIITFAEKLHALVR